MLENVETAQANYVEEKDTNIEIDTGGVKDEPSALIFKAGQSKRIWNELYKVTAPISHFMHLQFSMFNYFIIKEVLIFTTVTAKCGM